MKTLSVCMIVKNEEGTLRRILDNAKQFADEIIIVDTGSTDKTKEIASCYSTKIYDYKWVDDFAAARNFSFSKATKDYIMWLDADDVITPENISKIKKLMESNPSYDVIMCLYNISFDSEDNVTFNYYRERILKRETGFYWEGFVHEVITPRGSILHSDIAIEHRKTKVSGNRNLKIYEKKIKEGRILNPREQFYYGRELYYNGKLKKAQKVLEKFLKEDKAFIVNKIDASLLLKKIADSMEEHEKGVEYVLSSLKFTLPTSEICTEIGNYFFNKESYDDAIYWFREALRCSPDTQKGAFVDREYYWLIPCLSLCVSYNKIGDNKSARRYNDLASEFNPNDERVLYNKKYFDSLNIIDESHKKQP